MVLTLLDPRAKFWNFSWESKTIPEKKFEDLFFFSQNLLVKYVINLFIVPDTLYAILHFCYFQICCPLKNCRSRQLPISPILKAGTDNAYLSCTFNSKIHTLILISLVFKWKIGILRVLWVKTFTRGALIQFDVTSQ